MIPYVPKIIAIFILSVFITTVQSQSIDTVYREFTSNDAELFVNYSRFIQKASDTSLLLITNHGKNSIIDFNGRIIKDASLEIYPYYATIATGYFEGYTSDSMPVYYVKTIDDECDTWGGTRLHKSSRSGDYMEHITFHLPAPWYYGVYPSTYMVFPQKEWLPKLFLISQGKPILYFNPDSLIVLDNISNYRSHCINNDGDILLFGSDTVYYYKFNPQGPELDIKRVHAQYLHSGSRSIFLNDSTAALLTHDAITIYDLQLNLIQSISPFDGTDISMSKWQDPFLWVYSDNENIPVNFKVYDAGMNLIFQHKLNIYEKGVKDFYWLADSTLVTVGVEGYGEFYAPSLYSYVKSYLLSVHGQNSHQDIGLSGIEYDEVIPSGSGICMSDTTKKYIASNVKVKISNLGNSSINHLILIPDHQFCSFYCWHAPLYRSEFDDLNIEPGETSELFIGDVEIELDEDENFTQFCLSAILPDYHTDIDKENNRFCVQQIVQSITPSPLGSISLFPNPVENTLYIGTDLDIDELNVYSLDGKSLISSNSGDNKIDVSLLKQGIYIVKVQMGNGTVWNGKFIKLGY